MLTASTNLSWSKHNLCATSRLRDAVPLDFDVYIRSKDPSCNANIQLENALVEGGVAVSCSHGKMQEPALVPLVSSSMDPVNHHLLSVTFTAVLALTLYLWLRNREKAAPVKKLFFFLICLNSVVRALWFGFPGLGVPGVGLGFFLKSLGDLAFLVAYLLISTFWARTNELIRDPWRSSGPSRLLLQNPIEFPLFAASVIIACTAQLAVYALWFLLDWNRLLLVYTVIHGTAALLSAVGFVSFGVAVSSALSPLFPKTPTPDLRVFVPGGPNISYDEQSPLLWSRSRSADRVWPGNNGDSDSPLGLYTHEDYFDTGLDSPLSLGVASANGSGSGSGSTPGSGVPRRHSLGRPLTPLTPVPMLSAGAFVTRPLVLPENLQRTHKKLRSIKLVAWICTLAFLFRAAMCAYQIWLLMAGTTGPCHVLSGGQPEPRDYSQGQPGQSSGGACFPMWWLLVDLFYFFGEACCSVGVVLVLSSPSAPALSAPTEPQSQLESPAETRRPLHQTGSPAPRSAAV